MHDNGGRRWVTVGHSSANEAEAVADELAASVVGRAEPKLLVLFASATLDLPAVVTGVADRFAGVSLIGCSTAGEIATAGPSDASAVLFTLGGAGFTVSTAAAPVEADRLRDASASVATCVNGVDGAPHRILLLLSDGLAGDQAEVVRGAYRVVGAGIPLVGGCAGDDLAMSATYQFHGREVLNHAVVGAAIGSDAPMGIGVRHGWRRVGEPMLVTGSEGERVMTLNDAPALDVYLDRLQAPDEVRRDGAAFTRFALTHPLGLDRRSGEEVRFIAGADFERRSLTCVASVPQGGLAWFMEGDDDSVLEATDAACADALVPLGGEPALGFLAFDCIARRGVLGDHGIGREVERIAAHADGAPIAGFYTYGEIARTHGTSGFHNQTLVILAVG